MWQQGMMKALREEAAGCITCLKERHARVECRWLRQWAFFFFQAEDGIRDYKVTGVQTCALPIWGQRHSHPSPRRPPRKHAAFPRARAARPRGRAYGFGQLDQTAFMDAKSVGNGDCRMPAYTGFITEAGGGPKCPMPNAWPFSCNATVWTSTPGGEMFLPHRFPARSPVGLPKLSL